MSRTWVRKGLSMGVCWNRCRKPVHISDWSLTLYIPSAISYFTSCPTSLQGTVYKTATSWVRSVLCNVRSNLVYYWPQLYELLHVFCYGFIASSWFCFSVTYFLFYLLAYVTSHSNAQIKVSIIIAYQAIHLIKVPTVCFCFVFRCSSFLFTVCHVDLLI